jgi:hypothetical protein
VTTGEIGLGQNRTERGSEASSIVKEFDELGDSHRPAAFRIDLRVFGFKIRLPWTGTVTR